MSIKGKKGNPFEYDTAYSLQQAQWSVHRIDDNTKGVDLLAVDGLGKYQYAIECKFHKRFSWNQLKKIFLKSEEFVNTKLGASYTTLFIFKANQQPVLVMFRDQFNSISIVEFENYFNQKWSKRPKGYKIWDTGK